MSNYYYPNQPPMQGEAYETPNRPQQAGSSHDMQKSKKHNKQKRRNEEEMEDPGLDDGDDNEIMCDNEIFGDILTKMRDFVDKIKRKKCKKNYLTEPWQIFNDLLNRMDRFEENLTDEDLSIVRGGTYVFGNAMCDFDPCPVLDNDVVFAKEIFYMYFNLLNHRCIQDYLKIVEMDDDVRVIYRICTTEILRMMSKIPAETDLRVNDLQRPPNCIQLLSLMQNYVKTDLECSDLTLEPSYSEPSNTRWAITSMFLAYSDKANMVPDCIQAGWLDTLRYVLTIICKAKESDIDVEYTIQEQILTNINNASFHDDGVKKFIDLNLVDVVNAFNKYNENTDLAADCCMILALLLTPEQIKNDLKRMNYVLDLLLETVYYASISSDHVHPGSGYHLSELLVVFVKLFNDDRTLDYIMEHSQVDLHTPTTADFFIDLMTNYYSTASNISRRKQLTCTALVNILWSISFQNRYKQTLKNSNAQFKQLIHYFSKETNKQNMVSQHYIPKYIENIQKAATGLLVNMDEVTTNPTTEQVNRTAGATVTVPVPAPTPATLANNNSNKKALIMISYSHEDTEFCKQLYEELIKRNYDIWVDFNFLKTGDLWEQIAAGMKCANLIICLISQDYCKSKSCRLEATYALEKLQATKPVIPVMLRKHELPDWLDIRIAMLKYVRFRDGKKLEQDKLIELMDAIQEALPTNLNSRPADPPTHSEPQAVQAIPAATKLEKPNVPPPNSGSAASATTSQNLYQGKPIEQWNPNDIFQWFQYNQILPEIRDLCRFKDGYELINFARIFLENEQLQFQRFSHEFLRPDGITRGQRPLPVQEFAKFANALRSLGRFGKPT